MNSNSDLKSNWYKQPSFINGCSDFIGTSSNIEALNVDLSNVVRVRYWENDKIVLTVKNNR